MFGFLRQWHTWSSLTPSEPSAQGLCTEGCLSCSPGGYTLLDFPFLLGMSFVSNKLKCREMDELVTGQRQQPRPCTHSWWHKMWPAERTLILLEQLGRKKETGSRLSCYPTSDCTTTSTQCGRKLKIKTKTSKMKVTLLSSMDLANSWTAAVSVFKGFCKFLNNGSR